MDKRKMAKKLSIHKETLRQLEPRDLRKAPGGLVFEVFGLLSDDSRCYITCGRDSCLGACSLNCSWLC